MQMSTMALDNEVFCLFIVTGSTDRPDVKVENAETPRVPSVSQRSDSGESVITQSLRIASALTVPLHGLVFFGTTSVHQEVPNRSSCEHA